MFDITSIEIKPTQEEQCLSAEEVVVLKKMRNKRLLYMGSTYAVLSGAVIYACVSRWANANNSTRGSFRRWPAGGPEEVSRLKVLIPYFVVFCFLLLTGFFLNYYLKNIFPLIKDLKAGIKKIVFFVPAKYQTPFFAEYYLKTPLKKNPLIRVNRDFYNIVQPGSTASISYSPNAKFILSVDVDGQKINFNYSTTMEDI